MNRDIYRVVFNAERNTWMAVAENVSGRGGKGSSRRRRAARAALAMAAAVGVAGSALAGPTPPANVLPVPSSGVRPFVFYGSVAGGAPTTVGNTMTVNTASAAVGLNWASFNIGSDGTVNFTGSAAQVLNRIWDSNPSQILGRLNAEGKQIYLINQNGILFGNGAQVNVGGLVASALNLSDDMAGKLLSKGLPAANGDSLTFAWDPAWRADDGSSPAFANGVVTVEAGAKITTPSGGKVLLIAANTAENRGLIESGGGGEAILAAGGKVILTAPEDPHLRGLLVETGAFAGTDNLGNTVALDGTATNRGTIDMGKDGVVSLAALAVNQRGIVNATRAVNLNGTTMLVAGPMETDRITVNQRGDVAEIDWVSGFDVAAGKTVEFVQSSRGAVAYNYVHDADRTAVDGSTLDTAGRSHIDGTLTANGQLYLINEKGIAFGAKADVKAANFVASALGINPAVVRDGIFAQDGVSSRAFYLSEKQLTAGDEAAYATTAADAKAAFDAATVTVAKGAKIATTGENGFVMLLGSKVEQGGTITTAKGQTLIAAGADVYLKPPFSAGLRGFMAEVNPLYVARTWEDNVWGVVAHGAVSNTGTISAGLGNITLVGYDLTQAGTLQTSTSATANGSIRLVARDQLAEKGLAGADGEPPVASGQRNIDNEGVKPYSETDSYNASDKVSQPDFAVGLHGGKVTFKEGSVTEVAIDGSGGKTIAADQTFVPSTIEVFGKKIEVGGAANGKAGARLTAHGGSIEFMASEDFNLTRGYAGDPLSADQTATPKAGVGVFVGSGATLDVSGVTAKKSVSDLFIEVELRGDEFADNPVQRDGVLRGETAWVDIRDKVAVADLSGWTGKVGQTVEEKAATGGTISLRSTGSVIVKEGAQLDVSGGKVDYAGGTVSETRVVTTGGQTYRLNDAPATAQYAGITTVTHKEASYSEGRNAGTVEVVGNSLALDGTLKATTTPGAKQRNVGDPASDRYAVPLGGKLIIRDGGQHFTVADRDTATEAEKQAAYTQAQVVFVRGAANAAEGLDADSSAGPRLELSTDLATNGFSRFDIRSDGRIDVGAGIDLRLAPGGEFTAAGRQVYVAGSITTPGGTINLSTRDMSLVTGNFPTLNDARYSTLVVDKGATLSTAGRWVNDFLDGRGATTAKAVNGGKIILTSAYDLDLRAGSSVDVSGGGYVDAAGKLKAGNAGSIVLTTGGMGKNGSFNATEDGDRRDASLFLDGTLSAYALGTGGKLEINTSALRLGETFAADSRNWTRAERLAAGQVGAALDDGFFDRGGFYDFKLVGRDGVTVVDGARIAPQPVSWSLANAPGFRYQATGTAIGTFAKATVLHPDLRNAPTRLALATRSLTYGDLVIGENAYLGVSPQGSITLESWGQLTVLGTLEAPAGTISLSRPANRADEPYNKQPITYSEDKQSESIFLGANSRLLAGGTVVLDDATRLALEAGVSADKLRSEYRYKGEVLDGGTVDIDAGLGYLVTAKGSLIDVSGAQDRLNAPVASGGGGVAYPARTVGSAGGQVSLAAREGMFLDGSYKAAGKNGALGGVFSLRLYELASNATWDSLGLPDSMKGPRQLTLFQSDSAHPLQWTLNATDTAAYLAGGKTLASADYNGKATLDLTPLGEAGFGSWYLGSRDEIRFAGIIDAKVNNQLRLSAPRFSAADDAARVNFTAAAVQLGNFAPAGAPETVAAIGGAEATFAARDIGISGNFTWNGFAVSKFVSSGEIHFDSTANTAANREGGRKFSGQMTASGDIAFAAARLSPSTYSDYRVDLTSDADGRIAITRPDGAWAAESLAAGGRLEFAAATIDHDGTVTAPLGEIVFNAPGGKVTLGEHSITSVAAGRALLLGKTDQSGRFWEFTASYWNPETRAVASETYGVDRAPDKAIRIDAADSVVKSGATLDLSGGGEAIAAEHTVGPGGKTDILAASASSEPLVFAVLPGWNGAFAPTDAQAWAYYNVSRPVGTTVKQGDGTTVTNYRYDSVPSLQAGDQVRLAGNGSGLAGGTYTLLPASYALLPGAYLVTIKAPSDAVVAASRVQADGSWLVSGARLAANADGSATAYAQRAMTFEVASPAVVGGRARYQLTTLSDYFFDTAGVRLSGDAGQLAVVGRSSLAFDPTVVALRQAEIVSADGRKRAGEGLQLDLAAPRLAVSDGTASLDSTWSVLDQGKLNALGASSLLLGGTRTVVDGVTKVDTVASQVLVQNQGAADSGRALAGPEVMLAAKEEVKVAAGSRVESAGEASARTLEIAGDGAFLRVAEGAQATLSRTGTVSRSSGVLAIENGAVVGGRAVIADATRRTLVDGTILLGKRQADGSRSTGGFLTLGADRINVVGDGSTPSEGLTLGNDALARYAGADQLRLTSYTTLDLYGNASLGTADLNELVIAAAGVAGHGGPDASATIAARSVVFENPNPDSAAFTATGLGSGELNVAAQTVTFAGNVKDQASRDGERTGFAIRGFDAVKVTASGDLRFAGLGVTAINNDGGSGNAAALTVDAGRVVTHGGADHLLAASGKTAITGGKGSGDAAGLGGSLELRGKAIDVSGRIETPAGRLTLAATGSDATDSVVVQDGAVIAAEGRKVAFGDTFAYAPGGRVNLTSTRGNVEINAGAVVSVSAAAGGGDGGTLALTAKEGQVSAAAGTLRGSADAGSGQGALKVDAGKISLDNLADAVTETAADGSPIRHFGGQWDIRGRSGDLVLNKTVKAAEVAVAADNGGVTVASTGVIDASGAKGGRIGLYSRNGDVVLQGQLLARGQEVVTDVNNAGTRGQGGTVILSVQGTGKVSTEAGSLVDVGVAEGSVAAGGKVVFRADKSAKADAASDLNIRLAGGIAGASDVGAEIVGYRKTTNTLNTAEFNTIKTNLSSLFTAGYMGRLRDFLGFGSNTAYHIRPGVELASTGDLTVSSDLNFADIRFNGEAGVLTVRAAGSVKVNGTMSDGFVKGNDGGTTTFAATGRDARIAADDNTWSFRLVAGADTSAAGLTAVKAPSSGGNIEIAEGKMVRTGTGDITLAAQGDIKLANRAAVYTAGREDTRSVANFTLAPGPNDSSPTGSRVHYLWNGGDVSVNAGRNITQAATGATSDWLVTYSKGYDSTQWWARLASFQHGFAAFGGGDIALVAGNDVTGVAAVIPTNGRVPGVNGKSQPEAAVINGGGDLTVRAGNSISGGLFYAESGGLDLAAVKDVAKNPTIALGNSAAKVVALGNVDVGNIVNPMSTFRVSGLLKNSAGSSLTGSLGTAAEYRMRIGTYGADSRVELTAVTGDLAINASDDPKNGIAPSRVSGAALNGDATVRLLQMPGDKGQLDVLAAGDIVVKGITQYDVPATLLPSLANPVRSDDGSDPFPAPADLDKQAASRVHASTPWHAGDAVPSRLVALNGNISAAAGEDASTVNTAIASFNEAATIQAGGDVRNLSLVTQHVRSGDVTQVVAGGSVILPTGDYDNALGAVLKVNGPGRLEVRAGENVDLGSSVGIGTRGNLENPYLPVGGADVFVLAGTTTPDYAGLAAYLRSSGLKVDDTSPAALREQFFSLLRDYGNQAQGGAGDGYAKGRELIAALFPAGKVKAGNIDLFYSAIKTEQGGKADLMAPAGGITVGIANPSSKLAAKKKGANQGLFTFRGGDIRALTQGDFLVNQSRVFTLDGGDILIWSDRGSIDAGNGAKTVSATPPPVLVVRDGQIILDASNSVSGSGIGTLASRDDTPPSNMYLFAPEGAIDAGDAGLRSTGNITLGARVVLNANNIQAAGSVSGAPAAVAATPVAAVTTPTNNPDKLLEEAPTAAGKREGALGIVTVEVLGGEDCRDKDGADKNCTPG